MPRKSSQSQSNDEEKVEQNLEVSDNREDKEKIENLSRMLASVIDYLSDEENEVIDVEYIIDHTEGLREWHQQYQENNRKLIEEEIKQSLGQLSFEELQKIREKIKEKQE